MSEKRVRTLSIYIYEEVYFTSVVVYEGNVWTGS